MQKSEPWFMVNYTNARFWLLKTDPSVYKAVHKRVNQDLDKLCRDITEKKVRHFTVTDFL